MLLIIISIAHFVYLITKFHPSTLGLGLGLGLGFGLGLGLG